LTDRFYRRDPSASSDLPEDVKQVLASVEASFLAAAFDAITADYGNLENYFSDGLGLRASERASLQARYLES
jgi:protein-tyrosine phosphatase